VQLLTTAEAAAYLRLKERKIYEMVAEGAVPCTKVTGRWLFPKAELDHWLAASVLRPAGVVRPEPAPIVTGSHDPLLEWALRESGSGLATLAVGSEAGFARFVAGEILRHIREETIDPTIGAEAEGIYESLMKDPRAVEKMFAQIRA